MQKLRVSVAMATYNGARFVEEQLESFAAQTSLPDELVVCDDGSSDDTVQVVRRFARTAPFRVVVHENAERLGFAMNFGQVLSLCSYELVLLSDQDDVWLPEKIRAVVDGFRTTPEAQLLVHDAELVDEQLRPSGVSYLKQAVRGYGTNRSLVTGAMTAVKRQLLKYALPIPRGIAGHDVWLHNIAGLLGVRTVLPQKLQLIRRHGNNTSGWVASSTRPIGRWDVWRSQMHTTVASDYGDRSLINYSSAAVLKRLLAVDEGYSRERIRESLAYLERERRAIERRTELAVAGWSRQKALSLAMLMRGDYSFFNGYRSFLRDLTR